MNLDLNEVAARLDAAKLADQIGDDVDLPNDHRRFGRDVVNPCATDEAMRGSGVRRRKRVTMSTSTVVEMSTDTRLATTS